MKKISQLVQVFLFGWLLNMGWESLHSNLYQHYQGRFFNEMGLIERLIILAKAATFDATFIAVLVLLIFIFRSLRGKEIPFIIIVGLLFAAGLEIYALRTERWMYNSLMPLIPVLNIGVTPTIQLAITGLVSYLLIDKK